MNVDIVVRPWMRHHNIAAGQMIQGLHRHGIAQRVLDDPAQATADVVACWGLRLAKPMIQRGQRVLVMERGYVGNRMIWTSMGWDGLNGRAAFPVVDDGGERWNRCFDGLMQPRGVRSSGPIIVFGQVPGDASVEGVDLAAYYRRFTDSNLLFRPHPNADQSQTYGLRRAFVTLAEVLSRASMAYAFNSNALTDAVLAGVHVDPADPGAMAWPVSLMRERSMSREAWAHRLAWCQWLPEEIANGDAWAALQGDCHVWSEPERVAA